MSRLKKLMGKAQRAMVVGPRRALGIEKWIERSMILPTTGQVSLDEARFLGDLVRSLTGPGPIVEIGTLFGWSTRVMILAKAKDRELITVDKFAWNPLELSSNNHFKITSEILKEATENHNVRLVRADKAAFFASYDGPPPALAFLDAIHTYEETALDIAWAKKVGAGVICVHDYRDRWDGVIRAVDEVGGPKERVESLVVLK